MDNKTQVAKEARNVIVITDGDSVAKKAVEIAAKNVGGRCISLSYGNPTLINGHDMVEEIKKATNDPVLVMVDDRGHTGVGRGEKVLKFLAEHSDIRLLGVIAVASNTENAKGVSVNASITKDGEIVDNPVDKNGNSLCGDVIVGDTVSVINDLNIPLVIGLGDPGKMDFNDDIGCNAPITTKAVKEVLIQSGYWDESHG